MSSSSLFISPQSISVIKTRKKRKDPIVGQGFLFDPNNFPVEPKPKSKPKSKPSSKTKPKAKIWQDIFQLNYRQKRHSDCLKIENGKFIGYECQKIDIPNSKPHPASLVESKAMAAVELPNATYRPTLPKELVEKGVLSDVQLETIVYAGQAHSQFLNRWSHWDSILHKTRSEIFEFEGATKERRGFAVGDGTGVGKSRSLLGIVLDNFLKGDTKAIYISKTYDLVEDLCEAWAQMGGVKTQIKPLSKYPQGKKIEGTGILFGTYGTLRTRQKQNKSSRVSQIVDWVGEDFEGVLIFDEAHQMNNCASIQTERGKKAASIQGRMGIELQDRLPKAKIVYASATIATEVENLAFAKRLGLWQIKGSSFATKEDFISQMRRGGIAAMEIVCRDLKAMGLYLARSLSFEGINYELLAHELSPTQIYTYNSYAHCFREISRGLYEAAQASSGNSNPTIRSQFEGMKQRFFGQLILSMKMPTLIENMERDITNGYAPIVQLIGTGQSQLEKALANLEPDERDDIKIDVSGRAAILNYLETHFPIYLQVEVENNGETSIEFALNEKGEKIVCRKAWKIQQELVKKVMKLERMVGALDMLKLHFGKRIGEITGRTIELVKNVVDGKEVIQQKDRKPSDNQLANRKFMDGELDAVVLSAAGLTGLSLHAAADRINQKPRKHYLIEGGFRANVAIQGLGRSNRSNQVSKPSYVLLTSNLKGEKRFISTIAKRLASLGALTKGQQNSTSGVFKPEDNLENRYSTMALNSLMSDIFYGDIKDYSKEDLLKDTDIKLENNDNDGSYTDNPPTVKKFLNRLLAMPVNRQNYLFELFEAKLQQKIASAKARGIYQTGAASIYGDVLEIEQQQVLRTYSQSNAKTYLSKIVKKNYVPKLGKYRSQTIYLVSGVLLTMWEYLDVDCVRVLQLTTTNTNQRTIGRIVSQEKAKLLCQRFGAKEIEMSCQEILDSIACKTKISITQKWSLKQSMVANEARIEVLGFEPTEIEQLESLGCFHEIINFKNRVFIPDVQKERVVNKIKSFANGYS